ncbi:MAG TPA: signal peptidase I [Solirubrobacteraceae bacterium]|jgi:signal peptidase
MSRSVRLHRAAQVAARSAFFALLLAAGAMLALPLAGYHRYVITGGSMGGTIEKGSVIWAEEVPVAELAEGDVITYRPPPGAGPEGMVTHRIVSIQEQAGRRVYRTKGDANASIDPWKFELEDTTQARVAFHLPYLGYALSAASVRTNRMLVVALMALLIVVATFSKLWRDAGAAVQESVA